METLYKVLNEKGSSMHGGRHKWSLPRGKRAGKWTPSIEPDPCEQGWHLCKGIQLIKWVGPAIWVAEARGKIVRETDKVVCESARLIAPTAWDKKAMRLFAVDCAARVSHLMKDERSRNALRVARAFANGKATKRELREAAKAAYEAADAKAAGTRAYSVRAYSVRAAARAAASAAAADAVDARNVACKVARVAYDAAAASSYAVNAGDVAHKAERRWQKRRLLRYLKGLPCKEVKVHCG